MEFGQWTSRRAGRAERRCKEGAPRSRAFPSPIEGERGTMLGRFPGNGGERWGTGNPRPTVSQGSSILLVLRGHLTVLEVWTNAGVQERAAPLLHGDEAVLDEEAQSGLPCVLLASHGRKRITGVQAAGTGCLDALR